MLMQRKNIVFSRSGATLRPPVGKDDPPRQRQHLRRRRRRHDDVCWKKVETRGLLFIRKYKFFVLPVLLVAIVGIFVEVQFNDPLHITRWVDHQLTYRVMRRHFADVQAQLHQAGINDVPPISIAKANEIRFHAAITQVRWNQVVRQRLLETLEADSRRCHTENETKGSCTVPDVMLVPDITIAGRHTRPIYTTYNNGNSVVFFDAMDMHHLVSTVATQYPNVLQVYDSLHHGDDEQRVVLWAMCAVYYYGGSVMLGRHAAPLSTVSDTLSLITTTAYSSDLHDASQLLLLSAPPRHSFLGCTLARLQTRPAVPIMQQLLAPLNIKGSALLINQWYQFEARSACGEMEQRAVDGSHHAEGSVRLLLEQKDNEQQLDEGGSSRTRVEIQKTLETPSASTKQSLQHLLQQRHSEPGWICNRCLGYAARGTLDQCRSVCPAGYERVMCGTPPEAAVQQPTRELSITLHRPKHQQEQRIPRIIHQTWVQDISFERHPQFARLQASWKNTGWEYRFYTDDDARRYIVDHFPTAFVEAYDALIHGAYKADFFRYLVLLVDGGVYADVDVMLETTLDSFITPDMGFFGARDVPCEYAGEAFCIWNGLIGSEPGNPILVRAVERLVNLIRYRADMYDMEQEICRRVGSSMDIWKVRAQPLLFLTGPCGLGVAVNEALGRPSLARIELGSIKQEPTRQDSSNNGETIILVADKFDLGGFRFSDPRRNFVVASTELEGVKNRPRDQSTSVRKHHHYSYSRRYNEIWGSMGVYTDNQATREYIQFQVSWS